MKKQARKPKASPRAAVRKSVPVPQSTPTTAHKGRTDPVKTFISYSNRDRELLEQLVQHLRPLVAEGLIALYYDLASLRPGDEFIPELRRMLEDSAMVLFLMSPDSLASSYVSHETELALERSKTIIPIVLRPCDWYNSPLGRFYALPTGAKPVTTWSNRDEAFVDIARGLRGTIQSLLSVEAAPHTAKHDGPVNAIAITPDGQRVISGGFDAAVVAWDSVTLRPMALMAGHGAAILDVQVSPDGKFAATASPGQIKVWDLTTYRELRTLLDSDVTRLAFAAGGSKLLSGCRDGTVKVWDLAEGVVTAVLKLGGPVSGLAFIENENTILVLDEMGIHYFHLPNPGPYAGLDLRASGLCGTPGDHRVSAWDGGGFVVILDQKIVARVSAPRINAVRTLSSGRHAVSAHPGGLKLWDLTTCTEVRSVNTGAESPTALAITPDGSRAIWGSSRGAIFLWPIELSVARALPAGRDRLRLAYLAVLESPELWRVLETWDDAALSGIGAQLGIAPDQDVLETLAALHPNVSLPPLWAAWMETLHATKLANSMRES